MMQGHGFFHEVQPGEIPRFDSEKARDLAHFNCELAAAAIWLAATVSVGKDTKDMVAFNLPEGWFSTLTKVQNLIHGDLERLKDIKDKELENPE